MFNRKPSPEQITQKRYEEQARGRAKLYEKMVDKERPSSRSLWLYQFLIATYDNDIITMGLEPWTLDACIKRTWELAYIRQFGRCVLAKFRLESDARTAMANLEPHYHELHVREEAPPYRRPPLDFKKIEEHRIHVGE